MATTADLLDEPAARAARLVALDLLAAASVAHGRLAAGRDPEGGDPEALHDFRVAVRRLRSWLRAFRATLGDSVPRKAARRLRAVARATGASRDAEVHVAWLREQHDGLGAREGVGLVWLLDRTLERQRASDAALGEQLTRDFARVERRLSRSLEVYTTRVHVGRGVEEPAFAPLIGALIAEHGETLLRHIARVHDIADQAPAHQARIAAKRLRYLIEPIVDLVDDARAIRGALKSLQDALGDMHDVHVFSEEMLSAAATVRAERQRDPRPGLQSLARRLRERGERAFAEVERDWLAERGAPFFARVAALAARLEQRRTPGREIERKYLLRDLPAEAAAAPSVEVEQGYLPGERLVERLRRVRSADGRERFYRTVKGGHGLSRLEVEEETSAGLFERLWPLTDGRRVYKRRYDVTGADGAAWVLDEFVDRALVLAEVELSSAADVAEPPEWMRRAIVREVTGEEEYENARLAR